MDLKNEFFPKTNPLYWYSLEFGFRDLKKKRISLKPTILGCKNKHVVCIYPNKHRYFQNYKEGVENIANKNNIKITFLTSDWDLEKQDYCISTAISLNPDLIIMVPAKTDIDIRIFKKIYETGIPLICSNLYLKNEAYDYCLCWTGPDDWGQTRLLAHTIYSDFQNGGSYCIIRHNPGNSCYISRTWSMITELKYMNPNFDLLDFETTYLDEDLTEITVKKWIKEYGNSLNFIFCSEEANILENIIKILKKENRTDIRVYSVGYSNTSFQMTKEGKLQAFAYQSGKMDGTLAMQTAADWFSGLQIEAIRFLPRMIVTKDNATEFLKNHDNIISLKGSELFDALKELNENKVNSFFERTIEEVAKIDFVKEDIIFGFCLQVLSILIQSLAFFEINTNDLFSEPELVFSQLFKKNSPERSLQWLWNSSLEILKIVRKKNESKSLTETIIDFINKNYTEPISLKTISGKFNYSPTYIGQQFKKETGVPFSDFLNKKRIAAAKELLLHTTHKEKQIAHIIGYSNSNYFYRIFKKYTNTTPSEFREQSRQSN